MKNTSKIIKDKIESVVIKFQGKTNNKETQDKICLEILKNLKDIIKENDIRNFIISPEEDSQNLNFTYQVEDKEQIHTFSGIIHL